MSELFTWQILSCRNEIPNPNVCNYGATTVNRRYGRLSTPAISWRFLPLDRLWGLSEQYALSKFFFF